MGLFLPTSSPSLAPLFFFFDMSCNTIRARIDPSRIYEQITNRIHLHTLYACMVYIAHDHFDIQPYL